METEAWYRALRSKNPAQAVRRLLRSDPTAFRDNPSDATQLLSASLGVIYGRSKTNLATPMAEARERLLAEREIFDVLLDGGAPVDYPPGRCLGETPLGVAVQLPHPVYAEELLRRGANPLAADSTGKTPDEIVAIVTAPPMGPAQRGRFDEVLSLLKRYSASRRSGGGERGSGDPEGSEGL